jgi:hypothetical protein
MEKVTCLSALIHADAPSHLLTYLCMFALNATICCCPRYDRGTLSPLLAPVSTYSNVRRQPLPILTGILSSLLQPGNARGTAASLARAYSGGNSEAAAQAVASAAAGEGSAQANTVAEAISMTAANHPNVAPGETWLLQRCQWAWELVASLGYRLQQTESWPSKICILAGQKSPMT